MTSPNPFPASPQRPLSYQDLRRFLALLIGLVCAGLLIRAIGDILVLFIVILFVAMTLNPLVVWLEKRGIRRGLAVVLVMLGLIAIVVGVVCLIVPPMIEQVSGLVAKRQQYSQGIETQLKGLLERFPQLRQLLPEGSRDANSVDKIAEAFQPQLTKFFQQLTPRVGNQALAFVLASVGGVFTFIIALLLVAFTLANPRPLVVGFLSVVPVRHRDATGRSLARIQGQMVAWIRATLINGVLTGVSTGLLLHFIGVQPALVFGALSFFGEFVPNIGPIAASLPALFVAAGMGTTKLALTVAAIIFVQQVESNLLVPFIMGREMELHPVTIVFFALAMGAMLGVTGAILAVPAAAVVKILVDEFIITPNKVPQDELEKRAETLISEREWKEIPASSEA